MSANPALVQTPGGMLPAPFPGESFLLHRGGVLVDIHGLRTSSGKWSTRGNLFLSNIRLVFVANETDSSGLQSFDFPLVYMRNDTLNQPIFGCNNLSGQIWPAVAGGGPGGTLPPHDFKLYFKEGGIGTFYPLYYTLAERSKTAFDGPLRAIQPTPNPSQFAEELVARAFVDPNDPSKIYLSQPVDDSQRLSTAPKYASNYGEDEVYEPMEQQPSASPQPPSGQSTRAYPPIPH